MEVEDQGAAKVEKQGSSDCLLQDILPFTQGGAGGKFEVEKQLGAGVAGVRGSLRWRSRGRAPDKFKPFKPCLKTI